MRRKGFHRHSPNFHCSFVKGYCQQNVTSKCAIEEKGSRILREDRNFLLFSNKFQNELIGKVFEKNEDDGPQQESNDNGTEAITTTATPICKSNQVRGCFFTLQYFQKDPSKLVIRL